MNTEIMTQKFIDELDDIVVSNAGEAAHYKIEPSDPHYFVFAMKDSIFKGHIDLFEVTSFENSNDAEQCIINNASSINAFFIYNTLTKRAYVAMDSFIFTKGDSPLITKRDRSK